MNLKNYEKDSVKSRQTKIFSRNLKRIGVASVLLIFAGTLVLFFGRQKGFFLRASDESTGTVKMVTKPELVHGIHLTAWVAGSKKIRTNIEVSFGEKSLNTVVIAVKESNGEVYIPAKRAQDINAFVKAMPDIEDYLKYLKSKNIYTAARIVVFKDTIAAHKHPEWAVKRKDGSLWADKKGMAWLDPYNKEAWEYNFSIAEKCVELGFEEIQFDYIRFPSDGDISQCTYSVRNSSASAVAAINDFLKESVTRLKYKYGVNISADVFGLTCSVETDMGIGQSIVEMTKNVDFVCPMVYPSHYPSGSYGIKDPNSQPYKTVFISLQYAVKRLGENAPKLRPYLQDFTLGYPYGKTEVLAQIKACNDNNLYEWTLWNPRCVYTHSIFKEESVLTGKPKPPATPTPPEVQTSTD